MRSNVSLKLVAMGLSIGILLLGMLWIGELVSERQARRNEVVEDIAKSSSYAQHLRGPLLVVPYERTDTVWTTDAAGHRQQEERHWNSQLVLLPEVFLVDGDMPTERRARGIYETRLYHAHLQIHATFDLPAHFGVGDGGTGYVFGQPSIALGITDIRGIESTRNVVLNGRAVKLLAGTTSTLLGTGLHAPFSIGDEAQPARLELSMELGLQGTGDIQITPVGRDSRVALSSNWANPSFIGEYLPTRHDIGPAGFKAQWAASFFSTNMEEALAHCLDPAAQCAEFTRSYFGVSLLDPVDQYLETNRAIKYAFLFISLTFGGFFLFEVLKRLAVHPIQYGLVGAALALFYLLLLSLAEHVGFGVAYLLSAGACVSLIGVYVSAILRSGGRGLGFAGALSALYGTLYLVISADDYALLMGSALLFGLLAAVMLLTRNVDWFSLGRRDEEHSPS